MKRRALAGAPFRFFIALEEPAIEQRGPVAPGASAGDADADVLLAEGPEHRRDDAGAIETNWHRICTKDINVLGSWAFTANDIPQGIAMLDRARDRFPWYDMQTLFPFSEAGVGDAIAAALAMRTVKSTIVPFEDLG